MTRAAGSQKSYGRLPLVRCFQNKSQGSSIDRRRKAHVVVAAFDLSAHVTYATPKDVAVVAAPPKVMAHASLTLTQVMLGAGIYHALMCSQCVSLCV